MGTSFFKRHEHLSPKSSGVTNMAARAFSAPGFAGRAAGGVASKDVAAAAALSKGVLRANSKTAASNAPGPKKV